MIVIVLDISQLYILWKTTRGVNTESLIRNKLILKALARRTLNLSPERAVGEAVERRLKYSRGGNRTGDVFACHHLPSSAGTKATRGRPSASCLHYSCVKHLPLFLAQRGRAKMKQKRGYTVPKQRERFCALTFIYRSRDGQGQCCALRGQKRLVPSQACYR